MAICCKISMKKSIRLLVHDHGIMDDRRNRSTSLVGMLRLIISEAMRNRIEKAGKQSARCWPNSWRSRLGPTDFLLKDRLRKSSKECFKASKTPSNVIANVSSQPPSLPNRGCNWGWWGKRGFFVWDAGLSPRQR